MPCGFDQWVVVELGRKYFDGIVCPELHPLLAKIGFIILRILLIFINSFLAMVTILKIWLHFLAAAPGKYFMPQTIIYFVICAHPHPSTLFGIEYGLVGRMPMCACCFRLVLIQLRLILLYVYAAILFLFIQLVRHHMRLYVFHVLVCHLEAAIQIIINIINGLGQYFPC